MEADKHWRFFFGGLDILSRCEVITESNSKDSAVVLQDLPKLLSPFRAEVVEAFNKSNTFTNVSDLFSKTQTDVLFDPVIADIHIPVSLQTASVRGYDFEEGIPEDFKIIFDGQVLAVATFCSSNNFPWGIVDVRDKLKELLSGKIEFIETPPCLTHTALVVLNKGAKQEQDTRDVFVELGSTFNFKEFARSLYWNFILELGEFYVCCKTKNKIEKAVSKIHKLESLLLIDLKNFLETRWFEVLTRRRIVDLSKRKMVEVLSAVSEYNSNLQDLEDETRDLEDTRKVNRRLDEFLIKGSLIQDYLLPEKLDSELSMRVVEHSRLEIEAYATNTTVYVSALIGAVIGSILTLVIAYLAGNLNIAHTSLGNSVCTISALLNRAYSLCAKAT